jgi:hypothetical protein
MTSRGLGSCSLALELEVGVWKVFRFLEGAEWVTVRLWARGATGGLRLSVGVVKKVAFWVGTYWWNNEWIVEWVNLEKFYKILMWSSMCWRF